MVKETVYDSRIKKEAIKTGLPPEFIKAIIKKESMFNAKCELGKAYGLMQVTMPAAREVGYTGTSAQLFNPEINIAIGAKYLALQVDLWKNAPTRADRFNLGVASYNLGRSRILQVSEIVKAKGLPHLKWESIKKALPLLIAPKGLSRRRINIALNYVEMVNEYIKEFSPIHNTTIQAVENFWKENK